MAYDADKLFNVVLPSWDFGDGATVDVVNLRLPPGYKGDIIQIGVMVQETFACDNTAAVLKVGNATDDDAYALLTIADGAADGDFFDQTDDTDAIIAVVSGQDAQIPAGTLIKITGVVGVDAGTEAGIGIPMITFRIWK